MRKKRLRTPKKRRSKKTKTGVIATVEIMSRPKFLRNLKFGWHLLVEMHEARQRQFFGIRQPLILKVVEPG
ncbi:MAG: hypothetical protein H8E32_08645 [Nitrospinae bacterium]|nr:hypothetical protein [Nitrospinota bacterium]